MGSTLARALPDPDTEPTIDVARAAAIVGVSKRHGYVAAASGEWPAIRVGKSVRIPTARWLRTVGLVDEPPESASKADATPVTSADTPRARARGARELRSADPEAA